MRADTTQSACPLGNDSKEGRAMSDGRTHWVGCWRSHHDCAVAKIEAAEQARAEAAEETCHYSDGACLGRPFVPLADWQRANDRAEAAERVAKLSFAEAVKFRLRAEAAERDADKQEKEKLAVAARFEKALAVGTQNRERAEAAERALAKQRVNLLLEAAHLCDEAEDRVQAAKAIRALAERKP